MAYVSVIIPTHDRPEWLRSSISSVLQQTFQDLEVIVIDDASTVPVDDVIGSFHDTRIHYMRLEKSQGVAAARNVGLKHSQGKYIAFLDDDDSWLPPKLAKQVGLLDRSPSDYGCLYSGRRNIDPGNGTYYVFNRSCG